MKATHIVVIQSGWVFVGTLHPTPAPGTMRLDNAACIRQWGTTRGLGELALSGAQKATELDPCGTVEAVLSAVLFTIPVDPKKWK